MFAGKNAGKLVSETEKLKTRIDLVEILSRIENWFKTSEMFGFIEISLEKTIKVAIDESKNFDS